MSFLEEFKKRGYFYQCTNEQELNEKFNNQQVVAYIGFDCTAKSLHVGNLMQIMILRLLQKYGHKPIILIGGTTTKIGDPTGKDKTRKMLSEQEIEENKAGIRRSLEKFIKFGDGPSDAIMLDNSEWLEKIGYIEFLRDMGKEISVNRMLTMESAKARLEREQSLTFLEFNYMLLQAYDFYYLNKSHNCILQMGGSDQWGNIVMGTELVRKISGQEGFGLTTPLLSTSSGKKMGKSEQGAVWINAEQLSPYDYFQYWRNTEDADVFRFAKLYCEFSDQELAEFESTLESNINDAKKALAYRVTSMCHGEEEASKALKTAIEIFENGNISANLPKIEFDAKEDSAIYEFLYQLKLVDTKGEARRLVRGKAVKINDQIIDDENFVVKGADFPENEFKLSLGKKKHFIVKIK